MKKIEKIKKAILELAEKEDISAADVTKFQLINETNVTDWDIKIVGGINKVKAEMKLLPSSKSKQKEEKRLLIHQAIKYIADEENIHPRQVTQTQVLNLNPEITVWDIRTTGGMSYYQKQFPITMGDATSIRSSQLNKNYISKLERNLGEQLYFREVAIKEIKQAITQIKIPKIKINNAPKKSKTKKNMTMELMLSDLHIGKKTTEFNINVAQERLHKLVQTFLKEVEDNSKLYNIDRLIIALLGDIIESYTMHNLESASNCEFGNAKQIQHSINLLFNEVLVPIAKLGIKIDIPAVTGNHDRTDTKRTYNTPGANNMTWVIYKTLEQLCVVANLKNITFYIPEDSYIILPIYNNNCLYEHGDNCKNAKNGYEDLLIKRSKQEQTVIDFGRFGHYHEYQCYGRGRIVVNESICGLDSYAKVHGFLTTAGQTINYYIETSNRPTCFYKSFPVYLG